MRQMATPRKIRDIQPIPGADQIEVLTIDGWKVVAKKELHQIGEMVIYLEVDSWVPNTIAPFLSKGNEPKLFQGVPGERLRTVKLRGQISQGLVIPYSVLSPAQKDEMLLGTSLDEVLGILKWERPVFEGSNPLIKGPFPYFVPKTDQERIQNLTDEYQLWRVEDDIWEVTEKLDGSSMTVFFCDIDFGVASRNNQLNYDRDSVFWRIVDREEIIEKIASTGRWLALQGELIGPKIQGNKYDRDVPGFFVYDIYDIETRSYLGCHERFALCRELAINHVPVIYTTRINDVLNRNDDILQLAEGKSQLAKVEREGLVFKRCDGGASFKVISNKWLLKNE
jgi:RNA ligase (TIGR02306 family)